jgi:hypothetical protein
MDPEIGCDVEAMAGSARPGCGWWQTRRVDGGAGHRLVPVEPRWWTPEDLA